MGIKWRLYQLLRDPTRGFRRQRLERHLRRQLSPASGFTELGIAGAPTSDFCYRILLQKRGQRIVLEFDYRRLLDDDWLFKVYPFRLMGMLHLFARTEPAVRELPIEISDGGESGDGIVSFCSTHSGAVLIPDCDFYDSGGYASFRALAPGPRWSERDPTIVWRGSSTGRGVIATDAMIPGDSGLIPRTRLCLALGGRPGTDVKLSNVVQSPDPRRDRARLRRAGILGQRLEAFSWQHRRFALDIDGNSNAFSNLFTRLLLGCCVIKVASPLAYRQWYYPELRPYEHFVPVAADLSDLEAQLEWCRAHDAECAAIAGAGQAFALERSFEREMDQAVATLNRRFGGSAG